MATKRKRPKKARKLSKLELLQSKVKSLEKQLRKYEKQRFAGPLAPGQKRRKVPATEIDAVRSKLKLFLEGIKRELTTAEVGASYRSYVNEDQSIDAEIRVPLEDPGDTQGTLIDIEDAGNWNSLKDFWIMTGLNTVSDGETGSPTIDKRPNRAWTNPVRGHRAGAAFFTVRETVLPKLEEWGGQPTMIVVRLQWSPTNDRPRRPRK